MIVHTSSHIGIFVKCVTNVYGRLFFHGFRATNANFFSEKLSFGKISLTYGKVFLSYGENSRIFGKFASKTLFLGGIKQFFFPKIRVLKKIS